MNDCNDFRDYLGTPDGLTAEEQHALDRHLAECESCRHLIREYRAIMNTLATNSGPDPHPEDELLARYAVQLCDPGDADFDGRELSGAELQRVEAHLGGCERCRELHNRAVAEYNEIDAYFDAEGLAETLPEVSRAGLVERIAAFWRGLGGYGSPLYASATAMAVVLLWVSPLFRGAAEPYYALATLEPGDIAVVVRGASDDLGEGLSPFSEGRYFAAIDPLESYVQDNESGPDTPYARFVLGLAYLHAAKTDFFGRAHRVDVDLVERGLAHLAEAERTTESRRLREDALWFLAKGHLMKLDAETALEFLERVEALDRQRAREARAVAARVRELP